MELSQLKSGDLLAVGECNWDYYLTIYNAHPDSIKRDAQKRVRYYNVRSVPKPDKPGCVESVFGDLHYFRNHISTPYGQKQELTDAGRAIVNATFAEIRALETNPEN